MTFWPGEHRIYAAEEILGLKTAIHMKIRLFNNLHHCQQQPASLSTTTCTTVNNNLHHCQQQTAPLSTTTCTTVNNNLHHCLQQPAPLSTTICTTVKNNLHHCQQQPAPLSTTTWTTVNNNLHHCQQQPVPLSSTTCTTVNKAKNSIDNWQRSAGQTQPETSAKHRQTNLGMTSPREASRRPAEEELVNEPPEGHQVINIQTGHTWGCLREGPRTGLSLTAYALGGPVDTSKYK